MLDRLVTPPPEGEGDFLYKIATALGHACHPARYYYAKVDGVWQRVEIKAGQEFSFRRAPILLGCEEAQRRLTAVLRGYRRSRYLPVKRREVEVYVGYLRKLLSETLKVLRSDEACAKYATVGEFNVFRPYVRLYMQGILHKAWRESGFPVRKIFKVLQQVALSQQGLQVFIGGLVVFGAFDLFKTVAKSDQFDTKIG